MRIGLVVQGGFDRSGRRRVVPALLWLVERLARRHDVHVFALRHGAAPETYPLAGATVHDLGGFRDTAAPGVVRQLGRLLRALRGAGPFDVLHGYLGGPPGALTAIAGRLLHVPTVVTLDDGELVALPEIAYGLGLGWRGRALARLAVRLADRLTVTSAAMARACRDRGVAAAEIPLGVDLSAFGPAVPAVGPPRLLQVASLSPVKDQATLLAAFRRIADEAPDVHLDLVGEDTLRGAIQTRCAALDLDSRVTFHGFQPTDVVAALCARAHVYVQSSRHEAAGVAVLEAAACGVPAVGTAVGYVADWAPERAVAVPVGDSAALGAAVLALLRDEGRRRALGEAARAWVRAHDADWTASRFDEIYGQLDATRHA